MTSSWIAGRVHGPKHFRGGFGGARPARSSPRTARRLREERRASPPRKAVAAARASPYASLASRSRADASHAQPYNSANAGSPGSPTRRGQRRCLRQRRDRLRRDAGNENAVRAGERVALRASDRLRDGVVAVRQLAQIDVGTRVHEDAVLRFTASIFAASNSGSRHRPRD